MMPASQTSPETGSPPAGQTERAPVSPALERAAALVPMLLMAGTLMFFLWMQSRIEKETIAFPLDSYFYVSMAQNIRQGNGPRVDWPQGPLNKYFPGFAYWWALFLPSGLHPDEAIRCYAAPQCAAMLFWALALIALGRAVWRDWPIALGFAAIGSALPIALAWAALPMTEVLTGACVTACTAAAFSLLPVSRNESQTQKNGEPLISPRQRNMLLGALAFFGMLGVFTRVEAAYPLGLLVFCLVRRGCLRWTTGALVLIAAALPIALWQLWVTLTFGEANIYVAEGAQAFDFMSWYNLILFQFTHFIRVPGVDGPILAVNAVLIPVSLFFIGGLVAALRGYLGRVFSFSAWALAGYWLLHACWYYRTERYNIIIAAFGLLFFWEGVGRLVHLREGWRGRGGRIAMSAVLLLLVPGFWGHAWDNAYELTRFSNSVRPAPTHNQSAILETMEKEPHPPPEGRVFLTNLSLPDSRRLPGTVWLEKPDYVAAPYAPGRAQRFMQENKITHLALRPPIEQWMRINGQGLEYETIYQDEMVWIGRVKTAGAAF